MKQRPKCIASRGCTSRVSGPAEALHNYTTTAWQLNFARRNNVGLHEYTTDGEEKKKRRDEPSTEVKNL